MSSLPVSPPQTIGPFFSGALLREPVHVLAGNETAGRPICIEGRVLDGAGLPVSDALIEIWQANAHGRYNHPLDGRELPLDPGFTGFGRCGSDSSGAFSFTTVMPGVVPFDERTAQAPHLCVTIMARGLLTHLCTRIYFAGQAANATDPILQLVPAHRRDTLIARANDAEPSQYRFDIRLQGEDETVFFEF